MEKISQNPIEKINIDYLDFNDFANFLSYVSRNFSKLGKPKIFLSSHHEDGEKISSLYPSFEIKSTPQEINEDFFIYLRTSGSSGNPKLISKTFKQMCKEGKFLADFIEREMGLGFAHILCTVQPQHLFGLSFGVFMPWFLSFKTEIKSIEPFVEYVMAYCKDVLITSPTLLRSIAQMDSVSKEFKNLKLIISAGSPLEDEIRNKINTHAKILDIYGSTETGVIGYSLGNGLRKFDPVVLGQNEEEELIVTSPWCEEILIADRGRVLDDKIVLLGRSDDIVKINDKRFSLYEIENEIRKNILISDCFVFLKENRLGVVIELSSHGVELFRNQGKQGVIDTIKKELKINNKSYLRFFKIASKIPRNSQGKISKDQKERVIKENERIILSKAGCEDGVFEGEIGAGCFCFDGHFVDFPLVPGFVQLGLVMEYSKDLGVDYLSISRILNVKFTHFLRPADRCRLHMEKNGKYLSFKMYANEVICLSGRALLGEEND